MLLLLCLRDVLIELFEVCTQIQVRVKGVWVILAVSMTVTDVVFVKLCPDSVKANGVFVAS